MAEDTAPARDMTLQELMDAWGTARVARLAEQKKVDALEDKEKKLKAKLIAAMKEAKMTSGKGQKYGANYTSKDMPTAGDWPKIYAWIAANDAFDILHKRLTTTAIEARWEDGVEIPGIVKLPVDEINMTTV